MMDGGYKDVMTVSTAIDPSPENLIIKARFYLDEDFKECSYEFQHLLLEQIYLAFGEMLERVAEKAIQEQNLEQLMYENETREEFDKRMMETMPDQLQSLLDKRRKMN